MRTIFTAFIVLAAAISLSGCLAYEVVSTTASVAGTVITTTADVAGAIISAPFGRDHSDKDKDKDKS